MNVWHEDITGGLYLVGARGRLDQELTPQLEKELQSLIKDDRHRLIVDLSEVNYINSGGLRCLVTAWRQVHQKGGDLFLCGLNPRLQDIFAMVGFDKVFNIYPSVKEAKEAWSKS